MILFFGRRPGGGYGKKPGGFHGKKPGGYRPGGQRGPPGVPMAEQRIRTPHPGELFGVVTELHGGSRMTVQCEDGNVRMCRIPGKIRKKLWIKPGDVVIIEPWTVETNEKGDIAYRYTAVQVEALRRKGLLRIKLD